MESLKTNLNNSPNNLIYYLIIPPFFLIILFIKTQIGFGIKIHDKDFSVYPKDFLARRSSVLWDFSFTAIETLVILLNVLVSNVLLSMAAHICIGLSRISDSIIDKSFTSDKIAFLESFFSIYHTLSAILLLVSLE